ncbi:DUF1501 domain-containing protein [Caulobacter sp. SLTY]|uniref:DUF1501 domain-containing protein n=1 Tax=Caulobacter sp. SLTY TaxID=2683262 RepID=UPI00141370C7|nr:DUF1501 domain-containing protein [Caulobacter sp. SLTY]NBB14854.1 DUF1501 domain-containing protein [Caulobacter sp. SLTY]
MSTLNLDRRALLASGLALSFLGAGARAAEPAGKKLVVVVCRGGMDGLSVSPPVGDPEYEGLRRAIAIPGDATLELDSTFGLHPALAGMHALAMKGEARIVPALASPDRARSHFEAQDVLETGAAGVYSTDSGWLNRAVQAMNADRKTGALSVGATAPLILRGPAQAGSWSPGRVGEGSPRLPSLLSDLYASDPLLGPAFARGLETEAMAETATGGMAVQGGGGMYGGGGAEGLVRQGQTAAKGIGKAVAGFMTQAGGPQVVALSADGFDTHANQGAAQGQLANRLLYLDALADGMREGLGADWSNTIVVFATEFGRTARVNGTNGTDHGTGSTGLLIGGALKKGGIVGDWPTLKAASLYEGRDLRPTVDSRALFKGLLLDHMGVDRRVLDAKVFPDSAAVAPIAGLA